MLVTDYKHSGEEKPSIKPPSTDQMHTSCFLGKASTFNISFTVSNTSRRLLYYFLEVDVYHRQYLQLQNIGFVSIHFWFCSENNTNCLETSLLQSYSTLKPWMGEGGKQQGMEGSRNRYNYRLPIKLGFRICFGAALIINVIRLYTW